MNVAYLLAGRGRHVLVVDMDLEAPGLSNFLHRTGELSSAPGQSFNDVLTLMGDVLAFTDGVGDSGEVAVNVPPVSHYARSIPEEKLKSLAPKMGKLGRLDVIGMDLNRNYWDRHAVLGLAGRSQGELVAISRTLHEYFKGQTFPFRPLGIEDFEEPLQTHYDYVLVDSRTGITEIGGLCIGPLADRLVILTGLNDQNVDGTKRFLELAGLRPMDPPGSSERWDDADRPSPDADDQSTIGPKPAVLVASPVPVGEAASKRERLKELRGQLGIRPITLSYHPQLALMETVFVRDYPEEYLAGDYRRLTDRVMAQVGDAPQSLSTQCTIALNSGDIVAATKAALRVAPQVPEIGRFILLECAKQKIKGSPPDLRTVHAALSTIPDLRGQALSAWGVELMHAARNSPKLRERYLELAKARFHEASRIDPESHNVAYNWGTALFIQASGEIGASARQLLDEACGKFEEALRRKDDDHSTLYNWAAALLRRSTLAEDDVSKKQYLDQAAQKLLRVEELKPGHGAYNLACLFALECHPTDAIQWLKKAVNVEPDLTQSKIGAESDFNAVRNDPDFAAFVATLPA